LNQLQSEALKALAEMFDRDVSQIRESFVAAHRHDWSHDPFSRGAYSYTPVGATHLAAELAAPVKGTLFFAGEATDSTGEQGTVHAALESGKRAAMEMVEALEARRGKVVSTPT
jgi:monoamine oxidase